MDTRGVGCLRSLVGNADRVGFAERKFARAPSVIISRDTTPLAKLCAFCPRVHTNGRCVNVCCLFSPSPPFRDVTILLFFDATGGRMSVHACAAVEIALPTFFPREVPFHAAERRWLAFSIAGRVSGTSRATKRTTEYMSKSRCFKLSESLKDLARN